MTTEKSRRGRPIGSGKNDTPDLVRAAVLMLKDPNLSRAAAMQRVMKTRQYKETPETLLRRWHGKWQRNGAMYMQSARDMVQWQNEELNALGQSICNFAGEVDKALASAVRSPLWREIDEGLKAFAASPMYQAMLNCKVPPELTKFHNYQLSPEMKQIVRGFTVPPVSGLSPADRATLSALALWQGMPVQRIR